MDAAILAAGWDVLADLGYGGLTFEAVALRAGCHRPALYRRFGNKRELVLALVLALVRQLEPPPRIDSDPKLTLVDYLRGYCVFLAGKGGGATLGLSQARQSDPELSQALDQLFEKERVLYSDALNMAAGRPIPPAHCHLLIDAMLGAVTFRVLLRRDTLTETEIEELVDQTLLTARLGPRNHEMLTIGP
jgi:AcrR family transcriptional regulator